MTTRPCMAKYPIALGASISTPHRNFANFGRSTDTFCLHAKKEHDVGSGGVVFKIDDVEIAVAVKVTYPGCCKHIFKLGVLINQLYLIVVKIYGH